MITNSDLFNNQFIISAQRLRANPNHSIDREVDRLIIVGSQLNFSLTRDVLFSRLVQAI